MDGSINTEISLGKIVAFCLFFFLFYITKGISQLNPIIFWLAIISFISIGIGILIFCGKIIEANKNVLDYEPTILFGKQTQGKRIRSTFRVITTIGIFSILTGIFLFVFWLLQSQQSY
jgi:hypothetical protein